MGYETCTCADCGRREAMDLSREVRFAGEYGPLCDDCLSLALRVVEANAKDAANAAPDPALLALVIAAREWAEWVGFVHAGSPESRLLQAIRDALLAPDGAVQHEGVPS